MQRAVEVTRQATASVAATVDELRALQARLLRHPHRRERAVLPVHEICATVLWLNFNETPMRRRWGSVRKP